MQDYPHYLSVEERKSAEEKAKLDEKRRKQDIEDFKKVLSIVEGRRFLWRLMTQCRVFDSIADPMELIQYNAGRQDVGHLIQKRIVAASPESMLKMMNESKEGKYDVG